MNPKSQSIQLSVCFRREGIGYDEHTKQIHILGYSQMHSSLRIEQTHFGVMFALYIPFQMFVCQISVQCIM